MVHESTVNDCGVSSVFLCDVAPTSSVLIRPPAVHIPNLNQIDEVPRSSH